MNAGKTIYDTSEIAFAVDPYGQIVAWNEAAEHALGYTVSAALGQQCWELLSGQDIFGNPYCNSECPLHTTAFNYGDVNQFQVDFETADHNRKRFTVSLLMLSGGSDGKMLLHLCHPDLSVSTNVLTGNTSKRPAADIHRKILTPREITTLTLLHKGMSVPQIASEMGISVFTVRSHIRHVLTKLKVHTRLQAVTLGRRLGLI